LKKRDKKSRKETKLRKRDKKSQKETSFEKEIKNLKKKQVLKKRQKILAALSKKNTKKGKSQMWLLKNCRKKQKRECLKI
jgi:hypothetical protein